MLYTRKGDNGASGLFGTKKRLPKNSLVYDALGTLDELNSLLGICRLFTASISGEISFQKGIRDAQEALFIIQAELAGSDKHIDKVRVKDLEDVIDHIETIIGNPHSFVIPGATAVSAFLDYARTVTRRAERSVIAVTATQKVSDESVAYLNRLSSLLYAFARYAAAKEGAKEVSPSYQ